MRGGMTALILTVFSANMALAEVSAAARDALIADLSTAFGGDEAAAQIVVACGIAQLDDAEAAALNATTTAEERDAVMQEYVEIEALITCAEEVLG